MIYRVHKSCDVMTKIARLQIETHEMAPLPWASGLPVAIQWQSSVPGT